MPTIDFSMVILSTVILPTIISFTFICLWTKLLSCLQTYEILTYCEQDDCRQDVGRRNDFRQNEMLPLQKLRTSSHDWHTRLSQNFHKKKFLTLRKDIVSFANGSKVFKFQLGNSDCVVVTALNFSIELLGLWEFMSAERN